MSGCGGGGRTGGEDAAPPAARPEGVRLLLRAWRPELEIGSLEYLGEGDFCRAWLLNGRDVVRIPRHREAAEALAREACLLAGIAGGLAVPVPRPVHVSSPPPAPAGSSFSVHEVVPGRPLTRQLWRGLPEVPRTRLAGEVGRFLERLHALGDGSARACRLASVDHRSRMAGLRRRLLGEPSVPMPRGLRRDLDRCLGRYVDGEDGWEGEPVLLHADLSPGHVLVDARATEITGIIDWGDAVLGDPARDFIFLWEDWGSDFLELALEAYGLEARERLLPRVLLQYLADQLEWTLTVAEEGREAGVAHGTEALSGAVAYYEGVRT